MKPSITRGRPAHLLASGANITKAEANVDKIFLDWWLLARARSLVLLGPANVAPSSFFTTAAQYRDATSLEGDTFLFTGQSGRSCGNTLPTDHDPGEGIRLLASWKATYRPGCYQCSRICLDRRCLDPHTPLLPNSKNLVILATPQLAGTKCGAYL